MRECFLILDSESRKLLYERVLKLVGRNHPQRICVKNLCTDCATNLETMMAIIAYFKEHNYPLTDDDRAVLHEKTEWCRQGSCIGIDKPELIMSIQSVNSVVYTMRQHSSDLSNNFFTTNLSFDMDGEVLLHKLFEYQEAKKIIDKFQATTETTRLRHNDDMNIWVTWNEKFPDQLPKLAQYKNDKSFVFKSLGLGHRLQQLDEHYVALCFDTTMVGDLVLFRPGWGDATTYEFWNSIKMEKEPYGYTLPIELSPKHKQPEAVAANRYFSIEILSPQSFSM